MLTTSVGEERADCSAVKNTPDRRQYRRIFYLKVSRSQLQIKSFPLPKWQFVERKLEVFDCHNIDFDNRKTCFWQSQTKICWTICVHNCRLSGVKNLICSCSLGGLSLTLGAFCWMIVALQGSSILPFVCLFVCCFTFMVYSWDHVRKVSDLTTLFLCNPPRGSLPVSSTHYFTSN